MIRFWICPEKRKIRFWIRKSGFGCSQIRFTYGLMRIGWIWIVTSCYSKDGSFEKKSPRILAILKFKEFTWQRNYWGGGGSRDPRFDPKYGEGFGITQNLLRGYVIWPLLKRWMLQNLDMRYRIGEENDNRERDDRRSGCGTVMKKERDWGIRTQ